MSKKENKDFTTEEWRESLKQLKKEAERADESRQDTFDSWIVDLEDKEQPDACSLDDEDCEACGS